MLGSLLAPMFQWGAVLLVVAGIVWFIGRSAVTRFRLKQERRNAEIKEQQAQHERDKPTGSDAIADSVRDDDF